MNSKVNSLMTAAPEYNGLIERVKTMRSFAIAVPLLLIAAPAVAQPAPPPMQIPPELFDPHFTDRLVNMTQALSRAFLDLPAGEVEAAAEGRPATWADRHRTIGDMARSENPNFDRDFQRQIAEARPQLHAAQRAVVTTLPRVMSDLSRAAEDIDRAMQNLPRPDYPDR